MILDLVTVEKEENEKLLRQKSRKFDFSEFTKKDLRDLVKKMRMTMKGASGVGLAANQVGYDFRMFVAEYDEKFYAIFNPEIIKFSEDKDEIEEGCLSVPNTYGPIERSIKITLTGQNIEGKNVKIKARDFLARIFQHEVDHLNGALFIDNASRVYKTSEDNSLQ